MLRTIGYLFFLIERLKRKSITVYKTRLLTKPNYKPLWIGYDTDIKNPHNIFVGNGSYINGGIIYAGKKSKIIIGENCLISFAVHIRAYSHNYNDSETPIIFQGDYEKDIIIGNNVWIGHGVQILPGVTIGDNCIIGAGAVVTKDINSNSIAVGVPAKVIKKLY